MWKMGLESNNNLHLVFRNSSDQNQMICLFLNDWNPKKIRIEHWFLPHVINVALVH